MSIKLDCCLCCTPGSAYKLLQNEFGEINEIYEITVKYFDPKLLTVYANTFSKETQALCQDCWLHIMDFHEFQLRILKTHTVLEDTKVELLSLAVKVEEEQVTEQSIDNELYEIKEELNHVEDVFKCELEDNYGLKESNSTIEHYGDIKPLIDSKSLPKSITKLKSSKITKADENPKLYGDRKPKTLLNDHIITEKCDETSGNPLRKTKKPKDARKTTDKMFHNSSQHTAIDYPLANEEDAGDCPIADSENEQYSYNEIGAPNPKSFNRFENSAKRMLGQEYMGFSTSAGTFKHNSPKAGKQIGPMCLSAYCLKAKSRHCQEFDEETRKNIFKSFWNMNWDSKQEFVNKHVSQIPIKRKRVQDSKKQHSFLFKLPYKHKSLQVCRSMFLSTLSIKSDMVKGWLNANGKTGDNVSQLLS